MQSTRSIDRSIHRRRCDAESNGFHDLARNGQAEVGQSPLPAGLVGVFQTPRRTTRRRSSRSSKRARANDERFADLWPQIRTELLSHERAELREVYSVMRGRDDLRAFAEHHDVEANELEHLIRSIDELAIATPERNDLYRSLIETVTNHAREEEQEIFPKAQPGSSARRSPRRSI